MWNQLNYDEKKVIGKTLAKICHDAGSTGRITFKNYMTGNKLAKYSQAYGFKVY